MKEDKYLKRKDREKTNRQGLYVKEMEHDACGIGFVAHLKGKKSHNVIENALTMLENLEHRGATGHEINTGDGAGILIQIPHVFFQEECEKINIKLPSFGKYGVGMMFFPNDENLKEYCKNTIKEILEKLEFTLLGYRKVPTLNDHLGNAAKSTEPQIEQMFIKPTKNIEPEALERRLYLVRKYTNVTMRERYEVSKEEFYIATLSYKTIVYKGQLITNQIKHYFPDIVNPKVESALALVHSRFSTNTFPKWKLAQPFRYLAHNGEINTIRGNINWMKSYERLFKTDYFTDEELKQLLPICDAEQSDSSNLDKAVELLHLSGRPLTHIMMMLIPEAWEGNDRMEEYKKAFYEYHSSLIEPWDGPASICFTDGKIVGAILDRNGLRPSRFSITEDDLIIMSSEEGALPVDPSKIIERNRLRPGRIFVADLEQGRIINDEELKKELAYKNPYKKWLKENSIKIEDLPERPQKHYQFSVDGILTKQHVFGYTSEDIRLILAPMFQNPAEPVGAMGADIPLAVFSKQSQHLSHYFKQLFAQISNPPMDPIRERIIMSLHTSIGRTYNILEETPLHCKQIKFSQPVITNGELDKIRNIQDKYFKCYTINATFKADGKKGRLEEAIDKITKETKEAVLKDFNIILISNSQFDKENAPIPSLLATGAIHQYLIKTGLRARIGIVIQAGDVYETHHFATLIGFGANVINPYLAFDSFKILKEKKYINTQIKEKEALKNYIASIGKGLLKIFSKMGISTLQSYHGAQIFEILGLNKEVVDKCFTSTISRIGGLGFDDIAKEILVKQDLAFLEGNKKSMKLPEGGVYRWRRKGEIHILNPTTIELLQYATRTKNYEAYQKFAKEINDQTKKIQTIRGLLDFKQRTPIPIEQVEPKKNIFKRFSTGAMSFGSLSHEAHSTLAIAMNRIGAKSNSGEGGEDEIRFQKKQNGDWERSAIKQIASGRFGVTSNYLTNADELQIKIAQGAKPGEGGQLPGYKVDEWIARVRHSTQGVGLISPPPHHDIYSIEDLAQLIFDLKNANREARINVKLVSEVGVGTIAAGVAKAYADVILISGHDGGTGASPLSSIRHTGLPWELGLAESHQTLVKNNLRNRVVLQTDGQIRTGRDVAIATLLGAEEWGIATVALVTMGCIMLRKCHLNTCSVGVATQNPLLRQLFSGKPEYVINYIDFIVQELRELMAKLGYRTIEEMVGQVDSLKKRDGIDHWKIKNIDFAPILYKEHRKTNVGIFKQIDQKHKIDKVLDKKLIEKAKNAIEKKEKVKIEVAIKNTDRAVGTMLSNEISKKYGSLGLDPDSIHIKFKGTAGQSFGAFATRGLTLEMEGAANDYFGKGLSGAKLIIYPEKEIKFKQHKNAIIGNVAFYGATGGEAYICGLGGERFAVRNSGVRVIVEGVGDHGCEYMTAGIAIILGGTGRNFAAGMSGGIAYLYDKKKELKENCNLELIGLEKLDKNDIQTLKTYITNHLNYTNSKLAKQILDNWDDSLAQFVKVIPHDYKKALQEIKQKKEEKKKIVSNNK